VSIFKHNRRLKGADQGSMKISYMESSGLYHGSHSLPAASKSNLHGH
jgi:hypothetical protein